MSLLNSMMATPHLSERLHPTEEISSRMPSLTASRTASPSSISGFHQIRLSPLRPIAAREAVASGPRKSYSRRKVPLAMPQSPAMPAAFAASSSRSRRSCSGRYVDRLDRSDHDCQTDRRGAVARRRRLRCPCALVRRRPWQSMIPSCCNLRGARSAPARRCV
jgi:hypothetical protein